MMYFSTYLEWHILTLLLVLGTCSIHLSITLHWKYIFWGWSNSWWFPDSMTCGGNTFMCFIANAFLDILHSIGRSIINHFQTLEQCTLHRVNIGANRGPVLIAYIMRTFICHLVIHRCYKKDGIDYVYSIVLLCSRATFQFLWACLYTCV